MTVIKIIMITNMTTKRLKIIINQMMKNQVKVRKLPQLVQVLLVLQVPLV
ncbi:Uncharacterised protein [Mycobacteroides abscessus]|nr:Uncharacterised protein [Mycobacteroides abscessus]